MIDNFQSSLGFVLRHECAYAPGHDGDLDYVVCENVPGDSGGCTKYGIDAADHPGLDIPALTLGEATEIYRDDEWTECRCDELAAGLDTAAFDCAVNNGVHVAGVLLQRAIAACGGQLVIDGLIGAETIGQANEAWAKGPAQLLGELLDLRRRHYSQIVLLHPGDSRFLQGWLNRVDDLEIFIEASTKAAGAVIS
jgi:lysozyme family protein